MTAPALSWVVGSHGLLGQHVETALGASFTAPTIPWGDPDAAGTALRQGMADLLTRADGQPWNIAWCAGAGVVGSTPDQLALEQQVLQQFLDDLAERTRHSGAGQVGSRGAFFLASSAGGVYADSTSPPFTEATVPQPRTPYGMSKLAMEAAVGRFAADTGIPTVVGRIGNLYGPGQNLAKPQGPVSQICRTHLTGQPLLLYVPLDTMRDYIYVRDCADLVAAALGSVRARVAAGAGGPVVTKILASGQSTTVGGLLGESARIFRRRPRVVLASSAAAWGQVHDLRLRSTVWPELDRLVRTALPVGLAATARDVGGRLRAVSA